MKFLDEVKVIVDKENYKKHGILKGSIGTIILPEIRSNSFEIVFSNKDGTDYAECEILIEDLELIKDNMITDEELKNELPLKNPNWWCKVENGYILNLKGEKKNKIAYNYNS